MLLQVRTMFSKMLVFLCRASRLDGECDPPYVLEEKQVDVNKGKTPASSRFRINPRSILSWQDWPQFLILTLSILFPGPTRTILSEYLLHAVLKLLYKEVPENGRNLHQYFQFFWMYANLGDDEVTPSLSLLVLTTD